MINQRPIVSPGKRMHHPVILAVPLLMLLDYALTILGARASLQVYRRHFRMPHYELNPMWQKSVAQLRWFNPRHLGLVCLVTALLLLPEWLPDFPFVALQFPFEYAARRLRGRLRPAPDESAAVLVSEPASEGDQRRSDHDAASGSENFLIQRARTPAAGRSCRGPRAGALSPGSIAWRPGDCPGPYSLGTASRVDTTIALAAR